MHARGREARRVDQRTQRSSGIAAAVLVQRHRQVATRRRDVIDVVEVEGDAVQRVAGAVGAGGERLGTLGVTGGQTAYGAVSRLARVLDQDGERNRGAPDLDPVGGNLGGFGPGARGEKIASIADGPARRAAGVLVGAVCSGQVDGAPGTYLDPIDDNEVGRPRRKRGAFRARRGGAESMQPRAGEGRRVAQRTQHSARRAAGRDIIERHPQIGSRG